MLRLLGPVRADFGGVSINVGVRMQRFVLAVLALEVNRLVPTERLIDLTWPADPPRTARRVMHTQVSRLRATLSAAGVANTVAVRGDGPGYVLDCQSDRVDVHRFTALLSRARHIDDDETRVALLDEALALWRGPFLAGTASEAMRTLLGGHFEEMRLVAAEDRLAALLRQGQYLRVIDETSRLVAEHPNRQRLIGHLMLARHRAGRTVEALTGYQQAKRRFADEFGLDPPAELRQLETAILRDDPDPAPSDDRPAVLGRRPAQLPTDVPGFTGRAPHLAELDALVTARAPTAVVIAAVSGTAGVGKTALAVHWAHTIADRFPDGHLYVNLRGYDPAGRVTTPAEAVRAFLDALGVPLERIPAALDAKIALYRNLLAGKHILVVLDNARDAEQARPLLPTTPTALAVVTSRNHLTGLVATDGARPLVLDLLSTTEARDLLVHRLGDRVAAEPDAVDQIIIACARLPLALTVAAARAQHNTFSLAALATELNRPGQRLDVLDTGDPTTDVRGVFSWSYQALTSPAARLFRLLGLHPGPDISTAAAASLAGRPVAETRRLLTELARANLIIENHPSRYTFHDLLRTYAADLTRDVDPDDTRHAALTRLLDHYTHTAHRADRLLYPTRDPIAVAIAPPTPGASPENPADHEQAMAWLTTEHQVLLATTRSAADAGFDVHTWQLAWSLDTFLTKRGHRQDQSAAWQLALRAAERLDDPIAQATAHRLHAHADIKLGAHADADTHLRRALDLYSQAGDLVGQAHTHRNLAYLRQRQGQTEQALDHAQRSLALCQVAGHHRGEADALNVIGWYHTQLGAHAQALVVCEQALTLSEQVADRHGQAAAWDSLGYVRHHLGHHSEAADCYQHALVLLRDLGDRHNEAGALVRLGDTHHAAGNPDAARAAWAHALTILTDLDDPDAQTVRSKLDTVGPPGPVKKSA